MQLVVAPGGVAPAAAFFDASSQLLALLDEISDEPLDWEVSELRTGSAVAVVSAPEGKGAIGDAAFRVAERALPTVATAEGASAVWSPDAVAAARALAQHLVPTGIEGRPSYLRVVDDVKTPVLEHPHRGHGTTGSTGTVRAAPSGLVPGGALPRPAPVSTRGR